MHCDNNSFDVRSVTKCLCLRYYQQVQYNSFCFLSMPRYLMLISFAEGLNMDAFAYSLAYSQPNVSPLPSPKEHILILKALAMEKPVDAIMDLNSHRENGAS